MEKKLLTHKIIEGCVAGTDGGAQNAKVALVLAIIMFVLGGIMIFFPPIAFIFWGIAVLCLILRSNSLRIINAITKKKYTLQEDVCIGKGISESTEGPDSPYLVFDDTRRCDAAFPHAILNSDAVLSVPDPYNATSTGDTVYLLRISPRQTLYVFNSKYWEINMAEYTRSGKTLTPRKDLD